MKTVVVLSGGLDSAVLLRTRILLNNGDVCAVSFDYGQRHRREFTAARDLTALWGVRHDVVDLTGVGRVFSEGGSALTGGQAVPHGHYEDESMRKTVVPNRNMVFLSVAVALAISRGAEEVVYGAHAGDHAIYPDCRPPFVAAMQEAVRRCDERPPRLLAPFINNPKHSIVHIGNILKVPFELTWSCYEGGEIHCGLCGTCVERREAFALAGVADPTEYQP